MIRKYNYTGRLKISKDRIKIRQFLQGQSKSFSASIEVSDLGFPESAKIYIEPYFKSSSMRFDYGTVSRPTVPVNGSLIDIPITDRILYRVKIVDETKKNGLILGFCDEIIPIISDSEGSKTSLLPVDFNDLGSQIWRLEFRGEGPVLAVNYEAKIERIREIVKDSKFLSLVYPEVVRQVAKELLSNEEYNFEERTGWVSNWIKFFKENLQIVIELRPKDQRDQEEMIENIVEAFCRKHDTITHLIQ